MDLSYAGFGLLPPAKMVLFWRKGVITVTDLEKRAHELTVALLPHIMKESEWDYYIFDSESKGRVNPDISATYNDFYEAFLKHLI